jgi:hypothetical protein
MRDQSILHVTNGLSQALGTTAKLLTGIIGIPYDRKYYYKILHSKHHGNVTAVTYYHYDDDQTRK